MIEALTLAGFHITPVEYQQLWQALAGTSQAYLHDPARLKYILAPVLCRNAAEQARFYEVFDRYWEEIQAQGAGGRGQDEKRVAGSLWWKWMMGAMGLLVVGLMGYLIFAGPAKKDLVPVPVLKVEHPSGIALGDTLRINNTSEGLDTSKYQLRWELNALDSSRNYTPLAVDSNHYHWAVPIDTVGEMPVFQLKLTAFHREKRDTVTTESLVLVQCPNPPPEVRIIAPNEADTDQELLFTIAESPDPTIRYRWIFEGIDTIPGPTARFTFKLIGAQTVALLLDRPGQPGFCQTEVFHSIQIGQEKAFLNILPLIKAPLAPHTQFAIGTWLLLGILGLFVLLSWLQWAKKKPRPPAEAQAKAGLSADPRFSASDKAPYYIPFRDRTLLIRPSQEPYRLADVLRQRQEGLRLEVDVPSSVKATIDKGGFPELKQRFNTQPTDYLFLVDEQSPASHQARLFQYLVTLLREQDVHLDVFFYKNEPGRVWNSEFPNGMTLEQVQRQYPVHRLVVLGEGHDMLDPFSTGRHQIRPSLFATLRTWKQRILLTPMPPRSWGFQEAALQRLFVLFPADLRGMGQAAGFLEAGLDPSDLPMTFIGWKEQLEKFRAEPDPQFRRWRTLAEHREYLEGHPGLFRWLCATAVYPKPTWELTIAIGQALGLILTYDDLLILSRIPWLQTGDLHPRLRQELLSFVTPKDERLAREAVRQELAAVAELTSRGAANQELQVNLAIQDFALEPENPEFQTAIRQLLDAGLINRKQEAELDQVVQKRVLPGEMVQKSMKIEIPLPGIRDFLKESSTVHRPPSAPLFTPPFRRALALSVLWLLLFLTVWAMISRNTLEQWFPPTDQQRNFFFVKESFYIDSATIYNNAGVDTFYANHADDARLLNYLPQQDRYGANAIGLILRAQTLSQSPSLADTNLLKLYYNLGIQQYTAFVQGLDEAPQDSSTVHRPPSTDLSTSLIYFHRAAALPASLHALGLVHYFLDNRDSARVYYDRLLAETDSLYFDTLSIFPNLEWLLFPVQQPKIEEVYIQPVPAGGLNVQVFYLHNAQFYPDLTLDVIPLMSNGRVPGGFKPATQILRSGKQVAMVPLGPPIAGVRLPVSTSSIQIRMRSKGEVVDEKVVPYIFEWTSKAPPVEFTLDQLLQQTTDTWDALKAKTDLSYDKTKTIFPEIGIRGRYAIAKSILSPNAMEYIVGEPVFLSGPHRGNDMDWDNLYSAGRYNPAFLRKLKPILSGVLNNRLLKPSLQSFYDRELRSYLQAYYLAYPQFANNQEVRDAYLEKVKNKRSAGPFGLQSYTAPFATTMEKMGYDLLEAYAVSTFWVRRTVDGTEDEFYALLLLMIQTFDARFLQQAPDIQQQIQQGPPPENSREMEQNQPPKDPTPQQPKLPEMVRVPGGTFEMGDVMGDKESDDEQVHTVTMSDFMIGKYEVTFNEYDAFCEATGREKPKDSGWGRGNRPVIFVSWYDAVEYCNWLSEQHNLQPVYLIKGEMVTADWSAKGYRLPTEAEWEYAARGGGEKVRFGNGKDVGDPKEINFNGKEASKMPYSVVGENRQKTVPVGSLNSPNELGLHDMSGNVWEWCWNWYGPYMKRAPKDYYGPESGDYRVMRGGSWYDYADYCRVSYRGRYGPDGRPVNYGFRLSRTP